MKATTIIALLLCCTTLSSSGNFLPQKPYLRINHDPDSSAFTREDLFLNAGFEDWSDGRADFWDEVLDQMGGVINNVGINSESKIKSEGIFSAKVQSVQPLGGISHAITTNNPLSWNIYPETARAAVHYAKADGTSAWFNEHSLLQEDFPLVCKAGLSSAIRNAHVLTLDNGDLIELFSACSTSETSYQGAVYMKRNGSEPIMVLNYADHRTWTWPGVMDMGNKYVFVTMRIGSDGQQHLYATDISRDFNLVSNDRMLFEIDSTNVQCYSMVRMPDNTVVMPIVYAAVDKVYSGPWYLDILTTTDFSTVTRLNDPKTYIGRGLMEAYPVKLSDETVAILCRTDQGHLAKAIYNPATATLSQATATEIIQPKAGSYARNLRDNSILLCWLATIDLRKVLVMAVSEDDMQTWQSYHIVMTSAAMGHPMNSQPPYIHQPFLYEDAYGTLTCYYEEVITSADIKLYKTSASDYRINNVANLTKTWQEIEVAKPDNATSVQLLNIIGKQGIAYFDRPPVITEAAIVDNSGVSLYPNPVEDILYLTSDKPVTSVELFDMNGRLMMQYSNVNSIDMGNVNRGIYFVKVHRGMKLAVFKVVKI